MAGCVVHSPVRNDENRNSALNQPNPMNVIHDDFMMNELQRISQQQTADELVRNAGTT